ncbi:Asp23/Gls24 family envelope stress response protein [Sphaerisporangium sp. NPDC088356]|uniref:Asp23/Gls24 family envelope stress response protein n=1 Tax=Sphaerisporangium sp. NPDC088356 TaxID=3154871 RepID=UPI00344723BF
MSTETHAPGGPGPDPASRGGAGPVEARGRTEVSDRVLERVAARAVSEVDQIGGAAPRLLSVPLGRDVPGGAPKVSAHADGRLAIVRVTLSVTYPAPIRQAVHRVREHVMSRVHELTGLEARQVDIDVVRLIHPAEQGRRVL